MDSFKNAGDYSCEELLDSCQGFFGGQFWLWYQSVEQVVGKEKAEEVLINLARNFGELEVAYVKSLWGKDFTNLEELTRCFDVVHRMVGYDCSWTMENEYSGYETISKCPVFSTTPDDYKGKGICKIYCNRIGEEAYSRLNCKISRDKYLPDGDPYCGCKIEWKKGG
jgi:hypothetical protein